MQTSQLNPTSKTKLDELLGAIAEVLKSQEDCPHLTAVSASHFEMNNPLVFNGGSIVAPGKPQFDYEERPIDLLHQAFLKSAPEVYRIIINGVRSDEDAPWKLTPKLVSKEEQASLDAALGPLNAQIESELRSIKLQGKLDFMTFSRKKGAAEVGTKLEGKPYQRSAPSPKLLQILELVDKVYQGAGLQLVSATWSLRPDSFDYAEYYE